MKDNRQLSIVIPHYNSAGTLEKLLTSIPDIDDIEVLVVDDNSDVEQLDKIQYYVNESRKNTKIYTNDSNLNSAGRCRNIGLKHAVGEWILFADADDYFVDGWWEIVNLYLETDYDIVYFAPTSYNIIENKKSKRHLKYKILVSHFAEEPTQENNVRLRFLYESPWSKLISKEMIRKNEIVFDETIVSNDVMFSMICGYHANKICATKDIIYCITESKGTLTTSPSYENMMVRLAVFSKRYRYVKKVVTMEEWWQINLRGGYFINMAKNQGFSKFQILKIYILMISKGIRVFANQRWTIKYIIKKITRQKL